VFVSATNCELRDDRQEVKNTLLTFRIFPSERNGLSGILFLFASLGLTMVRQLRLALPLSLMSALSLIGLCQASLAQDYDLAGPDLTAPTTLVSGGVTLYQNVRIFDGKSAELSAPCNVLVRGTPLRKYLSARSPSTRTLMSVSLRQTDGY
jgi:hypothetical protein